jgi:hypothetical protein
VTDQSYDFIEQTFPASIDFSGGEGSGLGASAEEVNAAEEGEDTPLLRGRVENAQLRAWLAYHGMIEEEDTVPIRNLVGGWASVTSVSDDVTTWVSGNVGARASVPLTLTFEAGCGRVLFTSYHTHSTDGDTPSRWLNAQEMILGYLAFEIGTCVEDPILI